ncbi:MAG: anion permease [Propionibacteriaceae bacterium]|jgi:DASS family divalent anion:Na+ symporter|nr:anion permease [Propionibacteriaceae bacterium]
MATTTLEAPAPGKTPAAIDTKKVIWGVAALVVAIGLSLVPPPGDLTDSSMRVLGILAGAVLLWAGRVFHEAAIAVLMSTLFVVAAQVKITESFSAFSGTTFWLLVAAFALGAAVKECGLLERISINLLRMFPKSYAGQILGLLTVTTVTSPIIPSKAAKCSILSPLVRGMSDASGYKPESKPATGFFLSYYAATCFSPAMFISASVTTAALVGLYSDDIQAEYGFLKWMLCALPWIVLIFIGHFFYISRTYKPAEATKVDSQYLNQRHAELGRWSAKEKIMGVIMVLTIAIWVFKGQLGVPEYAAALFALVASLVFGILPINKWRTSVAWETLIFIGCCVSLSAVLPAVGITDWLVATVGPYTEGFFGQPLLLIPVLAVMTLLVRFLILSEIGFLTVFTAFLFPLATAAGVNPWVIGFILNAFVIGWFIPYQSSVYLTAIHAAGEGWVTEKATTRYCYIYCAIGLVAMLITYPIWQAMGIWAA